MINWSRVILIILFLVLATVLIRNAWLCDDAYISFRVVDNFVNGYGLTWNTAERVQAFTNPLWVLLLSCFYVITGEIYFTSIILSIVLAFLAVMIVALRVGRSVRTAIFTIVILILSKAFIDFSTSGLENPLTYLLLAVFFWIYYSHKGDPKTFIWLCLVASLGMVNRMDISLLYLPPLVYYFFKIPRKEGLFYGVVGFLPFIAWELFALFYYGFPFPNTYYAKLHTGIPAADLMVQGFKYYFDSLTLDPLTLLIIVSSFAVAWRSRDRKALAVSVGVVIYLLYVVKIGGDFMSGRFFAAPFLCAVALIAYRGVPPTKRIFWAILVLVVLIGISLPRNPVLSDSGYGPNIKHRYGISGMADERSFYYPLTALLLADRNEELIRHPWYNEGRQWREQGLRVKQTWSVGFAGFTSGPDVHIIDNYALADPLMARLPIFETSVWRIGHFGRIFPRGYMETILHSRNLIADSNVAAYYEKLKVLTRGEVFELQRLIEIWRFNTGQYDYLLNDFRKNGILEVNYTEMSYPKPAGNRWDRPDNYVLKEGGMILYFDKMYHGGLLEISIDNNDVYDLRFFDDNSQIYGYEIEANRIPGQGLRIDTLVIPDSVQPDGYNRIEILPRDGDGLYSVGHVRFVTPSANSMIGQ